MSFPEFTFTIDEVKTPVRSPKRSKRESPRTANSSRDYTPWASGANSARSPRSLRDPTPEERAEQDALQRIRSRSKRRQAEKDLSQFMNSSTSLRQEDFVEPTDPYKSVPCTPRRRHHQGHGRSPDIDGYLNDDKDRDYYDEKIREADTVRGRAERDLYFSKYGRMNDRRSLEPEQKSRHGGEDRRRLRHHKKDEMRRRRSSSNRR